MSILDQPVSEIFPPKWLKADLLGGETWTVIIESVSEEEVRNPNNYKQTQKKLCLWFEGVKQGFLPNPTQARAIEQFIGVGTTPRQWIGYALELSPAIAPNRKPTIAVAAGDLRHSLWQNVEAMGEGLYGEGWKAERVKRVRALNAKARNYLDLSYEQIQQIWEELEGETEDGAEVEEAAAEPVPA